MSLKKSCRLHQHLRKDRAQKAMKLWDDAEAGGSTSAVVAPGVSAAGGDRFTRM